MSIAEKLSKVKEAVGAELARRSHLHFMDYLWQRKNEKFIHGHHTVEICRIIDKTIEDYRNGKSSYLCIKLPFRHGKELADITPVLTTQGWKKHGELSVGDYVYGRDGHPVKVIAVADTHIEDDNEITFSDGAKIIAHDNHEWVVYDIKKHKDVIVETKSLEVYSNGRARYLVDHNTFISFDNKNLLIHPYVLGVWLGDGTSKESCINMAECDNSVSQKVESLGYPIARKTTHKTTGVIRTRFSGLLQDLKKIGVHGNKHIPDDYIYSSKRQRLELLAGLIDTDGYINKKDGRVVFSNTNKKIVDAVKIIVNTLGQRCTICEYDPKTSSSGIIGRKTVYQLAFISPFKLPCVLDRKKPKHISDCKRRRGILSVKKIKKHSGKCIQVEGGVYLVGETFIPTHNSDIVSRYLPANFIGKFPDDEIIVAGYSSGLVRKFSRFARSLIGEKKYANVYPGIELSKEVSNVDEWGIEGRQGLVQWRGIGGSVTGSGGNLIILDDFFKGREEAESEVMRDKVWESFVNDILTRAAPKAIVIVLATPWHIDDVFGRIKEKMDADKNFPRFKEIKFPAMSDDYDSGYLFPERFCPEWYKGQSSALGKYGTASLMQCDPRPRGGNIFPCVEGVNYHIVDEWEKDTEFNFVRCWDLASTEKQRLKQDPDWTVGVRGDVKFVENEHGFTVPYLYIDNVKRFRWEATRRNAIIKETASREETKVGIESFGAYKDAFTEIRDVLRGVCMVSELRLSGDKVAKASPLEPIFEAGNVFLRRGAWNDPFIKVISEFPRGKHDDDVDALACMYHMAARQGPMLYTAIDAVKDEYGDDVAKEFEVANSVGIGIY